MWVIKWINYSGFYRLLLLCSLSVFPVTLLWLLDWNVPSCWRHASRVFVAWAIETHRGWNVMVCRSNSTSVVAVINHDATLCYERWSYRYIDVLVHSRCCVDIVARRQRNYFVTQLLIHDTIYQTVKQYCPRHAVNLHRLQRQQ